MSDLTKQDLLSVGMKLLALYLFLVMLSHLGGFLTWVFEKPNFLHLSRMRLVIMMLVVVVSTLLPLLAYKISDRFAQWSVKSNHPVTISSGATHSLQSALLCSVGLFVFLTSFPGLVATIIKILWLVKNNMSRGLIGWSVDSITLFIRTILSLVLIFKAKGLTTFILKLRYAGAKSGDLEP